MPEILEKTVNQMTSEKVNSKPFDFLFRRTTESYPKSSHIALELPGQFKRVETPTILTLQGKSLQQDFVESVLPDGEILNQEVTYNLEHMSYLLTPEKTEVFYHCKNSTIKKHDKPCIIYMITNINYKTDELICKINGEAFSIKIIYFNQNKIDKILNTISTKDYINNEISEVDIVRLIHCLIFAEKNEAQNVIKRIIDIFTSIKKIKYNHLIDLHLALKTMIKYHFKNQKEIRRLLKMITEVMSDDELEKISSIEYRLENLENKIKEKDEIIKQNDIEKDKIIKEKDVQLEEKDEIIRQKDLEIERLKAK